MTRAYQLKQRAVRQAETRHRIVEATVELHSTAGPAHTTISAIAERAAVQRHTVYAHFPDERSLFAACTAHWASLHPFPDQTPWLALDGRDQRLRAALEGVYGWYETVERDLEIFERDAKLHAETAEAVARRKDRTRTLRDELARDWPRRKSVVAALGHAFEFETWRSLVGDQGLTPRQAVDAMLRFVASV
jgi:AcrR family transcriptional regulator